MGDDKKLTGVCATEPKSINTDDDCVKTVIDKFESCQDISWHIFCNYNVHDLEFRDIFKFVSKGLIDG